MKSAQVAQRLKDVGRWGRQLHVCSYTEGEEGAREGAIVGRDVKVGIIRCDSLDACRAIESGSQSLVELAVAGGTKMPAIGSVV